MCFGKKAYFTLCTAGRFPERMSQVANTGILEQHWNGSFLDSVDAVIQYASTMTWKGNHPVVALVTSIYQTGVKLTKEAMDAVETQLQRFPSLERWFVDIRYSLPAMQESELFLSL